MEETRELRTCRNSEEPKIERKKNILNEVYLFYKNIYVQTKTFMLIYARQKMNENRTDIRFPSMLFKNVLKKKKKSVFESENESI